jgi:hypothetical protein
VANDKREPLFVAKARYVRELCAESFHKKARADGQCLCGVFYVGVPRG